jgi:hypothetical protein
MSCMSICPSKQLQFSSEPLVVPNCCRPDTVLRHPSLRCGQRLHALRSRPGRIEAHGRVQVRAPRLRAGLVPVWTGRPFVPLRPTCAPVADPKAAEREVWEFGGGRGGFAPAHPGRLLDTCLLAWSEGFVEECSGFLERCCGLWICLGVSGALLHALDLPLGFWGAAACPGFACKAVEHAGETSTAMAAGSIKVFEVGPFRRMCRAGPCCALLWRNRGGILRACGRADAPANCMVGWAADEVVGGTAGRT